MEEKEKRCIKGNIELQSLPCILLTIFLHRFNGRLEVFKGPIKKILYFEHGKISFAASNNPDDRLGDILLLEGKINQQQYDVSVDELKKGRKRQGSILVQRGYLSMHELILSIRHQIKIILSSILFWKKGQFIFQFLEEPIRESVTLREDTLKLLRSYDQDESDEAWLIQGIHSVKTIFSFKTDMQEDAQHLSLTPYEMKIIQFLSEGERKMEQLCEWSDLESLDTIKSIHFLIERNLIVTKNEIWDNPQPY